jgi:hypothetical protein
MNGRSLSRSRIIAMPCEGGLAAVNCSLTRCQTRYGEYRRLARCATPRVDSQLIHAEARDSKPAAAASS